MHVGAGGGGRIPSSRESLVSSTAASVTAVGRPLCPSSHSSSSSSRQILPLFRMASLLFSAFTERQCAPQCTTREVTPVISVALTRGYQSSCTSSSTNSDTQRPKKQTARMRAAASEQLHATLVVFSCTSPAVSFEASDALKPASAHFSNPTICADDNSAELDPSHSQVSNGCWLY